MIDPTNPGNARAWMARLPRYRRTLLTRFVRAPRVCTCTSTTTVEEVTYSTGIPAAMARVTSAE